MKIRPVGADSSHADEEIDMMLIDASRNFTDASKKQAVSRTTSDRAVWFVYPIDRNLLKPWRLQQQSTQHPIKTDASVQKISYY